MKRLIYKLGLWLIAISGQAPNVTVCKPDEDIKPGDLVCWAGSLE